MLLINMVAPLLGLIAGHAARMGITQASIKGGAGQFAQSLPFGAGYSLGTYLGFPKNYQSSDRNTNKVQRFILDENKMAYGRTRKWFSFKRTSWYWKPTYHRKLRRTVYTHPKRRY